MTVRLIHTWQAAAGRQAEMQIEDDMTGATAQ
jgi:hypothetical protein